MSFAKKLILVTGGAGFIGSHLCERLVMEGHQVISLDNYFTGSRDNHVSGVDYREGHTKDIAKHVSEKPDLVYHLGEYSRAEQSFGEPDFVWDFNQTGTAAVFEFCRNTKTKIVYTASSTKFSQQGEGRFQSPYAWSKAVNAELVQQYGDWFGLPYAVTYFCNVYGGREIAPSENKRGQYATLIAIFKKLYEAGQPLTIREPGTQERKFTHIDDVIDALILVGEKGEGDSYVIADDTAYSILDVAELFGGPTVMIPDRPGNRTDAVADTSKTLALGWKPTRHLKEHIAKWKNTLKLDSQK